MMKPSTIRAFVAPAALTVLLACSEDDASNPVGTDASGTGGTAGAAGASGAGGSVSDAGNTVTVEPVESTELFANPGMGWQTFHHYADNDDNLDGLPSGSAYFRFTWKTLEPTDGDIDVDQLGDKLARARAAGQSLMFRVMTAGSNDSYTPDWLESAGCQVFDYEYNGTALKTPDLDDPTCWARFEALMRALSDAFGDEPDLQVDIGGVGLWGEWHFSSTTPEVPLPSLETRKKVVDLHLELFPNSPQTALIGNVEALAYATGQGTGWRADCLGDYGFFSDTWNHMDDMYKQHVQEAAADDAWQRGPVAWESCGVMQDWVDKGYDLHDIFSYALEMHGSFLNNKSSALPEGAQVRAEVEWLLETLGYRLVPPLSLSSHIGGVRRGSSHLNAVGKQRRRAALPPVRAQRSIDAARWFLCRAGRARGRHRRADLAAGNVSGQRRTIASSLDVSGNLGVVRGHHRHARDSHAQPRH